MASSELRMWSFNMGISATDYRRLNAFHHDEVLITNEYGQPEKLQPQEFKIVNSAFNAAQKVTSDKLKNNAEVYFLQEVGFCRGDRFHRPLIENLQAKNFEIIHFKPSPAFCNRYSVDTVIALDKNRFSNITNHSTSINLQHLGDNKNARDVAIASCIDKRTKELVIFASIHAPGCTLAGGVKAEKAALGDYYCQEVAKKVNEIALSLTKGKNRPTKVIAGDMNVSPKLWKTRFKQFQNYEIYRTGTTTNVNPSYGNPDLRQWELDYFLVSKNNPKHQAKIIHNHDVKVENLAELVGNAKIDNQNIELKYLNHSSDHFPIRMSLTLQRSLAPKTTSPSKPHQKKPPTTISPIHVNSPAKPKKKPALAGRVKTQPSTPSKTTLQPRVHPSQTAKYFSSSSSTPTKKKESLLSRIWNCIKSILCCLCCYTSSSKNRRYATSG